MTRWQVWPALGVLSCVTYLLIPATAGSVLSAVLGLVSLVVMVAGLRRRRPVKTGPWLLVAAGLGCWLVGETMAVTKLLTAAPYVFPSWADVCYLAGYLLIAVGLFGVIHEVRSHDLAPLLDSAVIITGNALVYWAFVIAPIIQAPGRTTAARLVAVAYPVAGMVLVGVVVPLVFRAGRRTPSVTLLTLGSTASATGNLIYSMFPGVDPLLDKLAFAVFMFTFVCFAGAAVHPTAASAAEDTAGDRFGAGRLVALGTSTLLVPVVLFVEGASRPRSVDWLAIGVGAIVISLAVLARLYRFTRQVRAQTAQLEELALRDELTGLPNRRLFERRLRESMPGSPQVAILDLDGFKNINDRLGHAVGDRLLAVVGDRLSGALRPGDLVARMGGDEFAVLVTGATPGAMDAIVRRLVGALRKPVEVDGQQLLVGTAVGSADTTGTDDPYEVLRRADVAMYASKQSPDRGPRRHTEAMDQRADELARLGAEMQAAIDTGQFHLVYQPIVELPTGRVASVEALVRWQHPQRGLVPPVEFIPVAEQSGLIVELGAWILQTACAQAVMWRDELGDAAPQRMSVNVSARQLAEPGFPDVVAQVLAWTGLGARNLVVEVTETAVFGGGQALRAVEGLHELGVRIALDDFGTGHSSLGLLQTVPVDVLKVDKSFVDNITMAGRHAVIATSLIHVADGLGLQAVAEGVETAEQAGELFRLGYRYAQGYHFGRPAATPDFQPVALRGASGPSGGSRSAWTTDAPIATPSRPG